MATTTAATLLEEMSRDIGDYHTSSTTSVGAGDGTTVIDTSLADLTEDDGGIQAYLKMRSGTDDGNVRRSKRGDNGYTASSTTVTLTRAFSAQIASGVTYELHRFDPAIKREAINRATQQLFPHLYLPLRDESLVVDNLLSNSGFETAASSNVHPSWSKVGTPTITDETSIRRHLTNSAKIIASGAAEGQVQTAQVNIEELIGKTVHAAFWVYATTADWARIRVDTDGGTTFLSSDYHTGVDEWQYLEIHETIPDEATQLGLRLEVANGGTAYFDAGYMAVGPVYKYTIPTTFIGGGLNFVEEQLDIHDPNGDYVPIGAAPTRGHILRLRGKGHLSQPTTEAGTTEVTGNHAELIKAKAAEIFFSRMGQGDKDDPRHDPNFWRSEVNAMLAQSSYTMRDLNAQPPSAAWHIEEDSAGKYIIFDVQRE